MVRQYPRLAPASAAMRVIAHGNSLTFGVGSSNNANRWPDLASALAPLAGSGVSIVNAGVSGQSISTLGTAPSTMMGTAPSAVDATLSTTKQNVLIAWEGINELTQNGINAAACVASYADYCAARRAAADTAGARLFIVLMTSPPARSATLTNAEMLARNAAFLALNTAIRTNHRAMGADACCDMAALPLFAAIFAAGTHAAPEYAASGMYSRSDGQADDNIHFGNAGYAATASAVALSLRRVRR